MICNDMLFVTLIDNVVFFYSYHFSYVAGHTGSETWSPVAGLHISLDGSALAEDTDGWAGACLHGPGDSTPFHQVPDGVALPAICKD